MVKKLPILLVAIFYSFLSNAQSNLLNCENGRYVNDVFTNLDSTKNIVYGHNLVTDYVAISSYPYVTTASHDTTLLLDIYQPAGDPALQRPLVIMAFGGSFIYNNRSQMADICAALARKGYVAATIDYRKVTNTTTNLSYTFLQNTKSNLANVVVQASADMKAAIRFLKHNATSYRIDTTKIFVGGYSSGAITALQTAYVDSVSEVTDADILARYNTNGGIEGNTDLASGSLLGLHTFQKIAGVLNISGAIFSTTWISNTNPPIYSMHGSSDQIVPFEYGSIAFPNPLNPNMYVPINVNVYGSDSIKMRANAIGLANKLDTIVGGDHYAPTIPANTALAIADAAAFFQPIVCNIVLPVTLTSFTVENSSCTASLKWQTASESKSGRYEVEVSTDGSKFMKVGVVNSKNSSTGADYSYSYKGFSGTAFFRLKMVDVDGSYTYSPIQKLNQSCGSTVIQVYPNPAKEQTLVTGLKAGQQVQLLNAQGQKLWMKKATGSAMQVPLAAFTSGLYLVQVADADGKIINNSKLMKE